MTSQLVLLTYKARPHEKLSDDGHSETPSTKGGEPLGLPHVECYVHPAHSPEVTSQPAQPSRSHQPPAAGQLCQVFYVPSRIIKMP